MVVREEGITKKKIGERLFPNPHAFHFFKLVQFRAGVLHVLWSFDWEDREKEEK